MFNYEVSIVLICGNRKNSLESQIDSNLVNKTHGVTVKNILIGHMLISHDHELKLINVLISLTW